MKKITIGIFLVVIITYLVFHLYIFYFNERNFLPFNEKKFFSINSTFRYIDNLSNEYMSDDKGAQNPDGTLDLLRDSLMKGDIDLASEYFIPEKRKYYRDGFYLSKKNEVLNFFIDDLNLPRDGYYIGSSTYTAEIKTDDGTILDYDLMLNPHTKIWKIESL